jgi:amidophosphoribosyltransferase
MTARAPWYSKADMCGIASILLCPCRRTPDQWERIHAIFSANLIANEDRGKFATGMALVTTGGQVYLEKMPLPATVFVQQKEYAALLEKVDQNTTLLLGHTRFPTKGDPSHSFNNHPIWAPPIVGIHNGEIYNDDELFEEFDLPRVGQVDSEIIFQLLKLPQMRFSSEKELTHLRSWLALLDGYFTFLACDVNQPTRLLAVTHGHPLCIAYDPALNILVFSSRYIFLKKMFKPPATIICIENDTVLAFDGNEIANKQLRPQQSILLFGENQNGS